MWQYVAKWAQHMNEWTSSECEIVPIFFCRNYVAYMLGVVETFSFSLSVSVSFTLSLPLSVRFIVYNGILYVRASGPEAASFSLSFCYCCCCRHRYWCCFSSLLLLTIGAVAAAAAGFLSLLYVITTSFSIAIVHLFYMHFSTIWLLCVFIMLPFASLALPSNAF